MSAVSFLLWSTASFVLPRRGFETIKKKKTERNKAEERQNETQKSPSKIRFVTDQDTQDTIYLS